MRRLIIIIFLSAFVMNGFGQIKTITLEEAISLGIQNSKQLKLSQSKIDKAVTTLQQANDLTLPSLKVSAGYSHALMLTRTIALPGSEKPITLPFDNTLSQATISVYEPIFDQHRSKYAKASADLLIKMSTLDAEKDKDELTFNIVTAYINYYKILQNQKILEQNLTDISNKLEEIKKYEQQGLAIRNDVLNFELQQSNIKFQLLDAESNRSISNYSMNLILGLPDSTQLITKEIDQQVSLLPLNDYQSIALQQRKEFTALQYQDKLADINIKKVQDEKLPSVGLNGSLYYINPSKSLLPEKNAFIAPFLAGINVSWDIGNLLKNKNKLAEVKIQKQEVDNTKDVVTDKIKAEVYKAYQQYKVAIEKINLLKSAVITSEENERVTESRFHNNLATTTERLDAETILYQSRTNLAVATADATLAYYNLLNISGQLH